VFTTGITARVFISVKCGARAAAVLTRLSGRSDSGPSVCCAAKRASHANRAARPKAATLSLVRGRKIGDGENRVKSAAPSGFVVAGLVLVVLPSRFRRTKSVIVLQASVQYADPDAADGPKFVTRGDGFLALCARSGTKQHCREAPRLSPDAWLCGDGLGDRVGSDEDVSFVRQCGFSLS